MSRSRRLTLSVLMVVVSLGGIASVARHVLDPVPSDGVRWRASDGSLHAIDVPASQPLLAPGDRLVAIDGQPISNLVDLLLLDRAAQVGDVRAYELERGATMVDAQVAVQEGSASLSFVLMAVVGFAALLAAFILLRSAASARGAPIAVAASIAFAAVALSSTVGWMDGFDRVAFLVDEAARLLLPPLLLHAALAMMAPLGRGSRALLYVPAAVIAVADVAYLGWAERLSPAVAITLGSFLERAVHHHLVSFVAAAVVTAVVGLARARGSERGRARWLLTGVVVGVGPYAALVALPRVFGVSSPLLEDLSILSLSLLPLALANAFAARPLRLEDLARGRATMALSVALTTGVALASGAILAGALRATDLPGWPAFVAIALLVSAGLLERLRAALKGWLEARFDREGYDARRTLVMFGRELAVMPDVDALARALGQRVSRAFAAGRAAVYVRGGNGREGLVLAHHTPSPYDLPPRLSVDVGLLATTEPIDLARTAIAGLPQPGFDLAMPFVSRDRVVGLLLLDLGRRRLGSSERSLLADLAGYVAVAIDNAGLHGELVKQAEAVREMEQFRASVLESLPVGVLIIDLDGRVLSSNRPLRRLVGCEELPTGCSAAAELPSIFLDPPRDHETVRRPLGDRVLSLGTSLLRRSDDSVQGRIIVVEDVTARVTEERERARRERLASVGTMSSGIAHEVNTPLTGIASYVQMLLAATADDDPRRPLLEKVEKQSFRAARLVRNLLNFARPGSEAPAPFDANAVVTDAVSLLEHEARKGRISLAVDLEPGLASADGRAGEIEQVVLNLIKNALDAVEPGGTVAVMTNERAGRIVVGVQDDGCGIEPVNIERIFDPFFTTKPMGSGHGLGLSVAYGIVKSHGGELRVESKPGFGTLVEIELPTVEVQVHTRSASWGGAAS